MTLRRGEDRPVPAHDPPGHLLATLVRPGGTTMYSIARDGGRTVLRYPELCEFVGDPALADVTVHLHPGRDPGLVPVLAAGALIAVHLRLRHEVVLHASAVQLPSGSPQQGRAVAFVGASGMGKSTLAAVLCANGCDLVSDDLLRLDLSDPGPVHVYPGSTENRLRMSARGLADSAPADAVRSTADGRLALRPRAWVGGPLPLAACVVPQPTRTAVDVSVRRLPTGRALLRMLQFPRVLGWRDGPSSARELQAVADLVERVPVFEASVPWGPPFRPEVVSALLEAVAGTGQR